MHIVGNYIEFIKATKRIHANRFDMKDIFVANVILGTKIYKIFVDG